MQMAEKYRLPKITLTEDAKQLMLKYKWPGNVRQLKNITEQMSVLVQDREIDAKLLSNFIPVSYTHLRAFFNRLEKAHFVQ